MHFPRLRSLVVLLCITLLAAACSDDPAPAQVVADAATGESVEFSDMDPVDEGGADEGSADEGGADEGSADEDVDMPDASSDERSGPYCALAAQADSRAAAFDASTALPAEAEEFYRSMMALIDQALETVPETIAGSLNVQRNVLVGTIEVLEPAGWDIEGAIPELTVLYEDPAFIAADEQLETFDRDVCGIDSTILETPDEIDGPVDEPKDVPAEFAEYCAASFTASERADLPFGGTADEVKAYYDTLVADIEALRASAPPELAADIETVAINFGEVYAILDGVEWDLDTGFVLIEEWASDPAIDESMNAAIDRLEAFDEDTCGILY